MSRSLAIVGATRGIGFEYVKQLSLDPENTVFALIRSQATAGSLNELAASRSNIHVIITDVTNPSTLQTTSDEIGKITNGKLDVLVYNAYSVGVEPMSAPTAFHHREEELRNEVIESLNGNFFHTASTVNTFLPLIRNGTEKKIIYISSGIADFRTTRVCDLQAFVGYAIGKSSGNFLMAKYAIELKSEGILTLAMSPGWVETDAAKSVSNSPEAFQHMLSSFQKMDPKLQGMISTEESVRAQLDVISSLDAKLSGAFVSHRGNDRDWF